MTRVRPGPEAPVNGEHARQAVTDLDVWLARHRVDPEPE